MFGWSDGLSSALVAMLWYFHLKEIILEKYLFHLNKHRCMKAEPRKIQIKWEVFAR